MRATVKPCDGKLNDQTLEVLRGNINRAQWGTYRCETCGRMVGVEILKGKWAPERHWPSVFLKRTSAQRSEPKISAATVAVDSEKERLQVLCGV
jgi:hypothetical protein